jgi:hypothetical protein
MRAAAIADELPFFQFVLYEVILDAARGKVKIMYRFAPTD